MTEPIPVNLSAIEQRAAQKIATAEEAQQVASQDRFIEDVERGFNPAAVERQQARLGRFRTLENRRRPPESQQKIQAVSQKAEEDLANTYSRRNPELPPDRLRQLRDSLTPHKTPEKILEEVSVAFEHDVTLADEALEYLEKATTSTTRDNVRRARDLLNELHNREIVAGRNVDAVAKSYHQKGIGNSPVDLRNLYRDITGNPRDHNALFAELSKQYPYEQLQLVVSFLLKGLAYDLKSKGPSIQAAELMRLMTETRNLQSILWVYLFFKGRMGLIQSLYSQYGLASNDLSFEKLAQEFIKLVEERYPSVMKLFKQAEKLGMMDDLEKIIIFMQYRDAIRGLSPRLYKSTRHRQDLLLVILEALEDLEEEDEEEASKKGKQK
jgi:type III secretion protein W